MIFDCRTVLIAALFAAAAPLASEAATPTKPSAHSACSAAAATCLAIVPECVAGPCEGDHGEPIEWVVAPPPIFDPEAEGDIVLLVTDEPGTGGSSTCSDGVSCIVTLPEPCNWIQAVRPSAGRGYRPTGVLPNLPMRGSGCSFG